MPSGKFVQICGRCAARWATQEWTSSFMVRIFSAKSKPGAGGKRGRVVEILWMCELRARSDDGAVVGQNVLVGHSGDVVGDDAGRAFGGDGGQVSGRQQRWVCDPGLEKGLGDALGLFVVVPEFGGIVEVGVEVVLGFETLLFHGGGEGDKAFRREANSFEGSCLGVADSAIGFGDQI